jgi:hypothetical protein
MHVRAFVLSKCFSGLYPDPVKIWEGRDELGKGRGRRRGRRRGRETMEGERSDKGRERVEVKDGLAPPSINSKRRHCLNDFT